jgi:hypothetical protein
MQRNEELPWSHGKLVKMSASIMDHTKLLDHVDVHNFEGLSKFQKLNRIQSQFHRKEI